MGIEDEDEDTTICEWTLNRWLLYVHVPWDMLSI